LRKEAWRRREKIGNEHRGDESKRREKFGNEHRGR
jgi:hypothetical protein